MKRGPGGLRLLTVCGGLAAVAAAGAFLLVSQPAAEQTANPPSGTGQASSKASNAGARWLEFDVSAAQEGITAFVVGYFQPGERRPAFTFEVPLAKAEKTPGGSLRLPLIVGDLPPGRTYEIRLRTVVGRQRSPWSEPSGTFTTPGDPSDAPAATPDKAERPARRARARSAVAELQGDEPLRTRLAAEFPGVDILEAAEGYRQVRDLAADLFAARNLKIPFAEIKKLTAATGSRNLQKAIAALKPGADARAEQRRARQQARALLQSR